MTKRQELKEKIIKELLPNWSVDPNGSFVSAEELIKKIYNSYNEYYFDKIADVNIDPENILTEQDYQELFHILISDIKKHVSEWKIEQEGSLTIIKHNSGKRKHYKKGFEKEEWTEIENALKNQQQSSPNNQEEDEKDQPKTDQKQQPQVEQTTKGHEIPFHNSDSNY